VPFASLPNELNHELGRVNNKLTIVKFVFTLVTSLLRLKAKLLVCCLLLGQMYNQTKLDLGFAWNRQRFSARVPFSRHF
jgi:hypothetical protein